MGVFTGAQATPGLLNILSFNNFKEFNSYMDYKGLEQKTINFSGGLVFCQT
jgi:hypothetical protein